MRWSPGVWSALAVDVSDGHTVWEHDAERLLPTASIGKLFLLHHLAEQIDADPTVTDHLIRRDAVEFVADSGIWQHLDVDALKIGDAARLVGMASDNLATNVLLDHVGLESAQAAARRVAPHGSILHDRIRDERGPDDPPTLSTGCAADWATYFRDPHPRVLEWLSSSLDLSMVASAFGLDPLVHAVGDRIQVWNKTGSDPGTRADVGVVHLDGRRVAYAAICRFDPADQLAVLARMRELGTAIVRG